MAVKTGYSGITIRDLTDDQLRQWFWFNSDGSGTIPAGAYVLSRRVEDFKESPTGIANLYMYSGAVKLQNGLIPYAILNGDGLTLEKGGIKAGTPGQSGFIYLSTENYPNSYSINGSIGVTDWKQIVGTNFGVRSDGTLYASEVNVAGAITAGEGSNVGSWVINDVSIHSTGKDEWDANIDGIYIGQYVDPELGKTIYTIAGGKTNYSLTGDTKAVEGKKYYQYNYVLSSDSVQDGSKTYYKYIQSTDQYVELTQEELITYGLTEDEEVDPDKVYYTRSETEPYVYTAVENPTGNPRAQGYYEQLLKSPVEQGWYEYVTNEVIVPSGESPLDLGLYESAGPVWYINSDGSANFGSLTVSQNGILDVPAAAISGTLTASQIEVDDLSAITANIGSTVNSEMTSNTLTINSEYVYVESNDDTALSKKEYYGNQEIPIIVEEPSGSPVENGYYEHINDEYVLSEDTLVDETKTYYIIDEIFGLIENPESPKINNYYEKVLESFINLSTERNIYKQTTDSTVVSNTKYYEYKVEYFNTKDVEPVPNKTYYILVIDEDGEFDWTPIATVEETDNPLNNGWYEKTANYVLVENPSGNPAEQNWYENDGVFTAEIELRKGNINISSNDKPVFSLDSSEENDINVSDMEVLERIKFGKLELVPFEDGLVVQVGG